MIVDDERKDTVPVNVGMITPAFVKNTVDAFVMFLFLLPTAYEQLTLAYYLLC